jgi:hypothetical protein
VTLCLCGSILWAHQRKIDQLDPAAWGSDHVNKPLPEYVTGGECLFCHRSDIGPAYATNRHHLTMREAEANSPAIVALKALSKELANETKFLLGGDHRQRFLKPSKDYGKADLLSVEWQPPHGDEPAKLLQTDNPRWDHKTFAEGCAGCHTTAVDTPTRAFGSPSLDCFTCHGDVSLEHTKDTKVMLLSKKRQDPTHVVTSICAQCHVRTGKSRSSGLPYPNNFVAGDNLFRDFQVDLSWEHLKSLNPADRHVLDNVREVVVAGKEDVTCLSCHEVHKQSSKKHRRLARTDYCTHCHNATGSMKIRPAYEVHSQTCGY